MRLACSLIDTQSDLKRNWVKRIRWCIVKTSDFKRTSDHFCFQVQHMHESPQTIPVRQSPSTIFYFRPEILSDSINHRARIKTVAKLASFCLRTGLPQSSSYLGRGRVLLNRPDGFETGFPYFQRILREGDRAEKKEAAARGRWDLRLERHAASLPSSVSGGLLWVHSPP